MSEAERQKHLPSNKSYNIVEGAPRGKRDGVIGHISERESRNWMKIVALLRDRSIWHPA